MEILGSFVQGDTAILVFILICFVAFMVMFYRVTRGLDAVSRALDSQRDEEMKVIAIQVRENLALLVRYQREANKALEALTAAGTEHLPQDVEPGSAPIRKREEIAAPKPLDRAEPKRAVVAAAAGLAAGAVAGVAMAELSDKAVIEEEPEADVSFDLDQGPEASEPISRMAGEPLGDFQIRVDPSEAMAPKEAPAVALHEVEEEAQSFISLDDVAEGDELDVADLMDIEDTFGAPEVSEIADTRPHEVQQAETGDSGDADLLLLDEQLDDSVDFFRQQPQVRADEALAREDEIDLGLEELAEPVVSAPVAGRDRDEDLVFSDSLGLVPDLEDIPDETGPEEERQAFSFGHEEVDVLAGPLEPAVSSMDETMLEALDMEEVGLPEEDIVLLDADAAEEDDSILLGEDDIHHEITIQPDDESDITIDHLDPNRPSEFSLEQETEVETVDEQEEPGEQHIDFGPDDDDHDLDLLIENLVDVHEVDSQPDDDMPALETELVLDDEEEEPETVLDIPMVQDMTRPEAPKVISMEDEEDDLGQTLSMEDFEAILEESAGGKGQAVSETQIADEDLLVITEDEDDFELEGVDFGGGAADRGRYDEPVLDETVPDLSVSEFSPLKVKGVDEVGKQEDADEESFDLGDLDLLLEDSEVQPLPARKSMPEQRAERPPLQFSTEDMELDFDYSPEPPVKAGAASPKARDLQQTAEDEDDFIDFIIDDDEEERR